MKLKLFNRPEVALTDFDRSVKEIQSMAPEIRIAAGPGAFLHPHEILGCVEDQRSKLVAAVTQSVYSNDTTAVKKRCLKFAYALIFAAASMDVMSEQLQRKQRKRNAK